MKATGIVRRIDDLGRVVVPKEIRRVLRIREGDPLEIYTGVAGEVILKKYSPIGELSQMAEIFAESVSSTLGLPVLVSDTDHYVAASGVKSKDYLNKEIEEELDSIIQQKSEYRTDSKVIIPILANGDPYYNPNLTLRKSNFALRDLKKEKIGEPYKLEVSLED